MVDFADLHKRYPLIFYGTLIVGHKALGHRVHDTFWATRCLDCPWEAYVHAVDGNPFDSQATQATFTVQATLRR